MSDLQHIQARIAQIKNSLETDPNRLRQIERQSAQDREFLRNAEARMIEKPMQKKTEKKNSFSEGDL